MEKKQLIALGIIVVSFFGFFYGAYLNYDMSSPFVNLVFFLFFITGVVASLFIGNASSR